MKTRKIKVKHRGNFLGIWFFKLVLRVFGLNGAYLLLEVVSIHYLLFDREAVSTCLNYIEKRFPQSTALTNYWHINRIFVNQGRQLIDRYAITQYPDYFEYDDIITKETIQVLQESKKGVVLLTSHVGNWQVALRKTEHLKKDICIVMLPEDNPAVREFLKIGEQEIKPVEVIDPEGYFGGVIEMMQALKKGKLVCIMGDRGYGFDTLEVLFLGTPAYFPYGAFYVAAAAGSPVVALLTHKISKRKYMVDISNIWYPAYNSEKNKKEQLAKWVKEYVNVLEAFTEKHPYECFLHHDVWSQKRGFK